MNYQLELEKIIQSLDKENKPKLLLHSCCAPCSSFCLEYLSSHFAITLYFYNPNIYPREEYERRLQEQLAFGANFKELKIEVGSYDQASFYKLTQDRSEEREGGLRCGLCFRLRLEETAKKAVAESYDYFATTLTISPKKNAKVINDIGFALGKEYNINWLPSDFKKKEGYKRSLELSRAYGLYRQQYCGCEYSLF